MPCRVQVDDRFPLYVEHYLPGFAAADVDYHMRVQVDALRQRAESYVVLSCVHEPPPLSEDMIRAWLRATEINKHLWEHHLKGLAVVLPQNLWASGLGYLMAKLGIQNHRMFGDKREAENWLWKQLRVG